MLLLGTCSQDGFITHSLHHHKLSPQEPIFPAVPWWDSRNQGYKSNLRVRCRDADTPWVTQCQPGAGVQQRCRAFSSSMHLWEHIQPCWEVLLTPATKPVKPTYHWPASRSIPTTATDIFPSQRASSLPVFGVYLHTEDNKHGRVSFLSQTW